MIQETLKQLIMLGNLLEEMKFSFTEFRKTYFDVLDTYTIVWLIINFIFLDCWQIDKIHKLHN
jgi:hypothetical protein